MTDVDYFTCSCKTPLKYYIFYSLDLSHIMQLYLMNCLISESQHLAAVHCIYLWNYFFRSFPTLNKWGFFKPHLPASK